MSYTLRKEEEEEEEDDDEGVGLGTDDGDEYFCSLKVHRLMTYV